MVVGAWPILSGMGVPPVVEDSQRQGQDAPAFPETLMHPLPSLWWTPDSP
jgi:hypothetical protein